MSQPNPPSERKTRFSRRTLLMSSALVVVAAGIAVPIASANVNNALKAYLSQMVGEFEMEDRELNRFLDDFRAYFADVVHDKGALVLLIAKYERAFYDSLFRSLLPGKAKGTLEKLEAELLQAFLLGTDMLDPKRPASQPVRYEYMPDPYVVGCVNRFATFDT